MSDPLDTAPPDIAAANARHDAEHGDPFRYNKARTRCGWNESMLTRGRKLTDRQISKWRKAGYYDAEFSAARRELWAKRAQKRVKREGNFEMVGDRVIYRP